MKLTICVLVSGFVAACAAAPPSDTAGTDQVSTADLSLTAAPAAVFLDTKPGDTVEHMLQAAIALSAPACHVQSTACQAAGGTELASGLADCGTATCSLSGCPIVGPVLRTRRRQPQELVHLFQLPNGDSCVQYSQAPGRLLGCTCVVDDN